MTVEELKARKKALGYTNKMISELSGVPLGTVNKVFSGSTDAPRYSTLRAIEDVLRAREYHRVELIEGNFYDMAQPSLLHQNVVLSLTLQFKECEKAHPEKKCRVFLSPVGVKLAPDNKTMVEPDVVMFYGDEYIRDLRCVSGPPQFLAEVLSPSNRDHDVFLKYSIYKKYGVLEYWIIDPDKEQVLVHLLQEQELPKSYTFDDNVPIGISDGLCSIDFSSIKEELHQLKALVK
ncbi:MAG: Uma2 family endonuclease [Firmicutes bacterium]|nr:Uma2 family endonuclease [Bacillota bacterium]